MAEQVNLKVELQSNLEQLTSATKGLKLDKGQEQRVEKYAKGAQLALDSGDLKTFQRNFNGLLKTFKDAAAATGKVSEEIQKLTTRQAALSKEINQLQDKKTKLETHVKGGKLTNEGAKAFYGDSTDAKKVIKSDGTQATRDEIIEIQKALASFLRETGKTLKEITNKDLETISKKSGVDISQRNSALAAERYVKSEKAYEASVPTQLQKTSSELQIKEGEYSQLTSELTRMTEAASSGAESIEKLYAEISKLGDVTNKLITEENNKNTKKKADVNTAPSGADISQNTSSTTGLGKAFKQFTLYNFALRAAKVAVKEAVQTVKELDQYLTEQAMVTGKTREETYALVGAYQDLAAQCGATTKEIAQVATEYMKQGKSTQEALVLTEAAVKAAKVAGVSVTDSVNYLTTALNGFQLAAEDAMAVSDKFAALAASSATDYDELAIALSKVASQANLAGMSMDYTTALLTKGLETTREAPETMGTALKTIIARMREMGDFGETLEGDTDINNVEKQLKYVDIALRDTSGELRSTEDVLDELGKKWDTLSKNQQAAVAKALAGTRQQARLIAMMEDYERVTELQEISQRSAGATAAQAGVYLEGMEAAMNRIQVAWENIVMKLTDSELIIGVFNLVADMLEGVADFLEDTGAQVAVFTTLGLIAATALGNKLKEHELNKEGLKIDQQRQLIANKKELATLREGLQEKKNNAEEAKALFLEKSQTLEGTKQLKNELKKKKAKGQLTAEEEKTLATIDTQIKKEEEEVRVAKELYDEAQNQVDMDEHRIKVLENENNSIMNQVGLVGKLVGVFSALQGVMLLFKPIYAVILFFQKLINKEKNKEYVATLKQQAAESKGLKKKLMNAGAAMAESAGKIPYAGWIIAAAILLTLCGIAIGTAIANTKKYEESAEGTADNINKLSNDIYELTQKSNELNKITERFQEIDNQVIKTSKDIEEMSSLLESAGDSLSTEKEKDDKGEDVEGTSEQEVYATIHDDKERLKYLEGIAEDAENQADAKRQEQLQEVKDLKSTDYAGFLSMMDENTKNGKFLSSQSAIRAIAYDNLYDHIDKLKEEGIYSSEILKDTESLTSSIIANMSALDALDYADNEQKMYDLVDSIKNIQLELKNGETGFATDVFLDEGKTINERIAAFKELEKALVDDEVALKALREAYSDFATLAKWDQGVLDFIDATNLSVDEINTLYNSFEVLQKQGVQVTRDSYKTIMDKTLKELDPNMSNLNEVISRNFGSMLGTGEEFKKNWDILLNQIGNIFAETVLDMGQNMEKFENTINGFYEKASEWGEMSESERMEFISENAEMFTGEGGEELLKAFQSGNYDAIETMLNKQMEEERKKRLEEVERTLAIEEAKTEEKQNKAYIAELKRYKEHLEDEKNLYKASLELRLEQEQNRIDEYKELLEKEQEALVDSLEKRKEAYEKYFNDIDQQEEDENYEEESEKLITNISKLASSGDADAKAKTMELEQQLKELEAERLQTLKERAREAILENMDNEIEEINDKFDKLLDSNQALLAAMQGDLEDPTEFLSQMIGNKFTDGATQLELEDYIGNLESIYGNTLDGVNWDAIKEEVVEQLFLNVNGQDITLNEMDERAVYEAVKKALQAIGKR